MVKKILKADNPKLRKRSKPVKEVDKKILSLIADLKETLVAQKEPEGIGLAAPQIGKNLKIFVVKVHDELKIFINPEITAVLRKKSQGKEKEIMEGCLSVPHYYGPLKRAKKIRVKYLTPEGEKRVETFEGLPAQIIQHEIDHLDGILFVDRLLEQKKPLYKLEADEWEKVDLMI